jgi:hypothetical protein
MTIVNRGHRLRLGFVLLITKIVCQPHLEFDLPNENPTISDLPLASGVDLRKAIVRLIEAKIRPKRSLFSAERKLASVEQQPRTDGLFEGTVGRFRLQKPNEICDEIAIIIYRGLWAAQ